MKFLSIRSEGGLLPYDILEKIHRAEIQGQKPEDFNLKNRTVIDEVSESWKDVKLYYAAFSRTIGRLGPAETGARATREQFVIPLLELLGFPAVNYSPKADESGGKSYAISHRVGSDPDGLRIHITGCNESLDRRSPNMRPRLSPHSLVQEYLNNTEHLWAIVTNGYQFRLLRDSSKISRPVFVEFDLRQIIEEERFNDFVLFYRIVHFSRFPVSMHRSPDCLLEKYYNEAVDSGGRVREKLRIGVEDAIRIFGVGFLKHPANSETIGLIKRNEVTPDIYFRQILRLIYRLLFLMVSEERNLCGPSSREKSLIYGNHYSVNRFRELSGKFIPGLKDHVDLWRNLTTTFHLYTDAGPGHKMDIAPLGGDLFSESSVNFFGGCQLTNRDLLKAINRISIYEENGIKRRINYLALDVEELGSVYESLLEYHPVFLPDGDGFAFDLIYGSERKTTGSYYTNHDLVHQLVLSALDPVISRITLQRVPSVEKTAQLLDLKICDPASGSGHFLLAAARRIANKVAYYRSGEDFPSPEEYRNALRDVIQRCIYGVDLNPLAVDLCKLALWLEGHSKGKPLSFLDHKIKCGNSLVGCFSGDMIRAGIPDDAYKPVLGDSPLVAASLRERNKEARKGERDIFKSSDPVGTGELAGRFRELVNTKVESLEDYRHAKELYKDISNSQEFFNEWCLANIWTYAFYAEYTEANEPYLPTSEDVIDFDVRKNARIIGLSTRLALNKRFFHWYLEFYDVFEKGGFDCILGNPPWERIKLQEKEFFESRSPQISNAKNAFERKKMIGGIKDTDPVLFAEFQAAKRNSESDSKFIRHSERFPLSAVGDINTYQIFGELCRDLLNVNGRAGVILPTGIATDDATKTFFGELISTNSLHSLYDFENRKKLFPGVHSSFKFCLLTMSPGSYRLVESDLAFFLTEPDQLQEDDRHFTLTREEFILLNPNTRNCPIFRSKKDAELTKIIYRKFPILINDETGENPWGIKYSAMFHMANDSHLFIDAEDFDPSRTDCLPLYEAKLFHHYNHRFASYTGEDTEYCSPEQLRDPDFSIKPRYYIKDKQVEDSLISKLRNKNDAKNLPKWLVAFRNITNVTNERTAIFSIIPFSAVGHSAPLFLPLEGVFAWPYLLGTLASFVFDYCVRQKLGGTNFTLNYIKQLPVPEPVYLSESKYSNLLYNGAMELTYNSFDLKDFAKDYGFDCNPFKWDEDRRFLIRCELDAIMFKLYGIDREDVDYIMDTFPIVRKNDEKAFGEYRTKRVILEIFDNLVDCETRGVPYETRLYPPAADPTMQHP